MGINTRLARLEQATEPERRWLTVYELDGRRWISPGPDYRSAYGGPGAVDLTPAEFVELERTHDIILVKYVDWRQHEYNPVGLPPAG